MSPAADGSLPVKEVLIVGAGIGGLGAAISLGRRGVRCTVVENAGAAVGASIVFTHRAVDALHELGVLDRVLQVGRHLTRDEPSWWTHVYNAKGEQLPVAEPVIHQGDLPLTLFIYRPLLAEILADAAREHGAEVLIGHTYRAIEPHADCVDVELSTGERRTFDLVVGADGVSSGLRERFFPEAGKPHYTGSMCFRMMFNDAPEDWLTGLHVAHTTIATTMLPGRLFYLAVPANMERRRVDQDEARQIVTSVLADFAPSRMFAQAAERLTDDVPVLVAPYEWIFVPPPWHRGRIVLLGDAVHATAPTLGSAGGMALEDGVVLAEELARDRSVDASLTAYAERREARAKLVVETSAALMKSHQEHRPVAEEAAMRLTALEKLGDPY